MNRCGTNNIALPEASAINDELVIETLQNEGRADSLTYLTA